jgi:hypothetical protein
VPRFRRVLVAFIVLATTLVATAQVADAATGIVVKTTADSGAGSLRQAILDANATPALDNITFAIHGSGIHVITLQSALPSITAPVNIDGRTQPGYVDRPLIEVYGISDMTTFRVDNSATGSSVNGLSLTNYASGIQADMQITVEDSWIGIHADGTPGPGQPPFLYPQANGIQMGPGSAVRRSVIGRNSWAGIAPCGHDVEVTDNLIGTDPTGTVAVPNDFGVLIGSSCPAGIPDNSSGSVDIGTPGHGNLISGSAGIGVFDYESNFDLADNTIGVTADGVTPLPNGAGVAVRADPSAPPIANIAIHDNFVRSNLDAGLDIGGGSGQINDNDVMDNGSTGISISGGAYDVAGNRVEGNGGLGIDLSPAGVTPNDPSDADTGPDGLQNFPQISSVTRSGSLLTVAGSLSTTPNVSATIELYQSPACDASGFGEGATPRGTVAVSVPSSGIASWQVQLPVDDAEGPIWTATATTSDGTSEFSQCATDSMVPTPAPVLSGWQSIGGRLNGAPAMASPASSSFISVVRGLDDQVWQSNQASSGAAWTPWSALGGRTFSAPAAVGDGAGTTDVAVRGADDALWYRTINGSDNAWTSLGGDTHDAPALARTPDGTLHVFVRGVDNALWHRERPSGGAWSAWENVGGRLLSAPASATTSAGELDVVVEGNDGAVWQIARPDGGAWGGWVSVGGALRDAPAIAAFSGGALHLFVRGLDDQLWHAQHVNGQWTAFTALGGRLTSGPGAAADQDPNRSEITIAVRGSDGSVWVSQYAVVPP